MDAPAKTRWLTPAILTLFITSIALGALEFSVVGMQEELSQFYGRYVADIGLFVTVFAIGVVIGTPMVMLTTGNMNRFRLMSISMLLLAVFTVVPIAVRDYNVMLACRFVQAVLSGAVVSSAYVFSTDLPPPEHRAKALTLVFAGYSVSSVFIIPVVETLAHHFGIEVAYAFIIALEVVAFLMMLAFVPRHSSVWVGNREDEKALVTDRRIVLALVMTMFAVGAVYMVYSYIATIFVKGFGIPEEFLYIYLFLFGVMCIISNVVSAHVESHGGIKALKYVFVAQALVLVGISVCITVVDNDNWIVGVIVTFMLGVIMYIINTPIQSYYLRVAKRDHPGGVYLSSCFQSISFNMGVALGSMLGGFVFHYDKMGNVGYLAAVLTVVAIIFVVALERRSKPEDLKEM